MGKKESFSVRLQKDSFNFAAAHFMTFENGIRESIHGHNFSLELIVTAKKLKDSMVVDFLKLESNINALVNIFHNKTIVAANNANLKISVNDQQVDIVHQEELISIPKRDCAILPIENSSTELLAKYAAQEIYKNIEEEIDSLEVCLEEAKGCFASYIIKVS